MFSFSYDPATTTLHSHVEGLVSAEEAAQYVAAFHENLADAQSRADCVHILIDASASPVQQQSAMEQFSAIGGVREGARVAVVVASQLGKMQAVRKTSDQNVRAFLNRDEAANWLANGA